MKIKILCSFIIIASLTLFLFPLKKISSLPLLKRGHSFLSPLNSEGKLSEGGPKSITTNVLPNLDEIENEFNHLDLSELQIEVKKINLNKDYQQLLANANEQVLTQSDRHLLSSFLKRKGLLHKLIMDKELDLIESEEL